MSQHLLESTVFAAAVWLLTLVLRRRDARVRHALWMAASLKFLVPFSLLVAMGDAVRPSPASVPPAQMRFTMVDAAPALPYAVIAETARPDWRVPVVWLLWLPAPPQSSGAGIAARERPPAFYGNRRRRARDSSFRYARPRLCWSLPYLVCSGRCW